MKRVLVTGAAGFLGQAIVSQAQMRGIPVRATDQRASPGVSLPDFHLLDLCALADHTDLLDGVEVVIHAAGLAHQFRSRPDDADRFRRVNVLATAALAEAAARAGVRRLVFVSSVAVYGHTGSAGSFVDEDAPTAPAGPYAESKREAERRLHQVAQSSGMHTVILRMATLFGENDPGNVARLTRAIDRGRFVWIGSGENMKSLVYREDAARACLLAATDRRPPSAMVAYNVVGCSCPMRDIITALHQLLGRRPPRYRVPARLATSLLGAVATLPMLGQRAKSCRLTVEKWLASDAYDGTRFCRDFRFEPSVSLAEGLQREVAWYRRQCETALPKRRAA
jgi:UDP-glucose 4-epimerase